MGKYFNFSPAGLPRPLKLPIVVTILQLASIAMLYNQCMLNLWPLLSNLETIHMFRKLSFTTVQWTTV